MYEIDKLYNSGKLPARYYSQLNGKTAQENYNRYKEEQNQKNESFIINLTKSMLSETVRAALNEIFKGFKI